MDNSRFISKAELTSTTECPLELVDIANFFYEKANTDFNNLAFTMLEKENACPTNVSLVFAGYPEKKEYASIGISYNTTKSDENKFLLVCEGDSTNILWKVYRFLVAILSNVTENINLANSFQELIQNNPHGPVWRCPIG